MATTVEIYLDPEAPYTFWGSAALGTPSILKDGLQLPSPLPVLEYAPPARFLNGEVPVSSRVPNATLGMRIKFESADEAAHATAVSLLRAGLATFTYFARVTLDSAITTWTAYAGTLTPGARHVFPDGTVREEFTIVIPVHPTPVED